MSAPAPPRPKTATGRPTAAVGAPDHEAPQAHTVKENLDGPIMFWDERLIRATASAFRRLARLTRL
jgi:hypothetical protein